MIVRSRDFMPDTPGEPLNGDLLAGAIREWQGSLERLAKLRAAYENDRDIRRRYRQPGKPNNRLAHGYAKYIATMSSGYMVGKPVTYSAPDGQEKELQAIIDEYKRANMDSVDIELARQAAIYGKAVMIVYADEQSRARAATISPEQAFVVYDDTVESRPLFGAQCAKRLDIKGKEDGYAVTVSTDAYVYEYEVKTLGDMDKAVPVSITDHSFGALPLVEVWNDENEQGDFEQVQSLIDAYDIIESDRTNDTEQHVNALLVMTGATMETDDAGRSPAQQIRQDRMLMLPNGDAHAQYLTADLSQADVEVLKDAIKADIHKFSMVPDLTDENFAGNASGVAMKYKLLGLESLIKIKEPWFVEALRERLRLYANYGYVKGMGALDVEDVTITLSRALPVNELEIAQTVTTLQGLVPDKTLLAQIPFVDDVQAALDELEEQRAEQAKRDAAMYGFPTATPDQTADDKDDEGDDVTESDDGNAAE